MVKQMIATIAIFIAMIGAGVFELFSIKNNFASLQRSLENIYTLAEQEVLSEEEYMQVWNEWEETREHIEFFLNHTDFSEINFRMSECYSYVKNKDYDSAMAHIGVLIELTKLIPHQIEPTPEHIL